MYQVQNITDDPIQQQTLQLPDQSLIQLNIYFSLIQIGWFIQTIQYNNFTLQGVRITNSPNILYQYINQIPFGLACFSNQAVEPMQAQSFASGASSLFILTAAECLEYQQFLEGMGT